MRKKLLKYKQFRRSTGFKNMRQLKMTCSACLSPAIIRKTVWVDETKTQFANVYCACTKVECGKTWVSNLTYHHGLSPSGLTESNLVKELISRLRPGERQMMLDFLQNS
ncbi:ogr/Delta-like zinc finger family protein [Enterobacter ludwigii]|uniref:ogr/Delta-like zinc finger family protein n=1 Tax=Enterobacter ludwigii TaxID=299767 RepID=UPI00064393A5|nr:ogr/Delta-like zinc finger family protein [Enterobacter ludwigii]KLP41769.1 hypothetical protein ABR36_07965 [Enterobacter ludwigii]